MTSYTSIAEIQQALRSGAVTCRALVEQYLQRASDTADLNAYVEIWAEEALQQADETDRMLRETPHQLGRMFGAVLSIKDNICYKNHQATAGSRILSGFASLYSATAVERLVKAGAIIIGRTNCDQFGMGSSNENSAYGPVRHPMDPARVPGGSSGGAAVSVATGTCVAALGSDTGGSVRQPAGFCGLWGLKPSYGRISRHGLIAYGSSFDQIGFLTHNASDAAWLLSVCSGADDYDGTATTLPVPDAELSLPDRPLRLAYFPQTFESESIDAGVRAVQTAMKSALRTAGHQVEPVEFPLLDYTVPAYYVLTTAEASSNLSRFDGMRYGYRSPMATDVESTYQQSRSEGFSDEVKRRIMLGAFVLSSGYYDAYYTRAQQVRRLLRDRVQEVLNHYDAILLPVAPSVAWKFGEKSDDPTAMYLSDIFTVLANLCGMPAISMPLGRHPENGMPIGIQLLGKMYNEAPLLAIGHQIITNIAK